MAEEDIKNDNNVDARKISLERGPNVRVFLTEDKQITRKDARAIVRFIQDNKKKGLRVFVAGGARSGNSEIFAEEAYKLGRTIGEMGFKLDFGLSSKGIMWAVARGVLEVYSEQGGDISKESAANLPINAITTDLYMAYYENDAVINKVSNIIVAKSLEERKRKLLEADFVVFASGGLGTLDELAYDCVAMQDGMLPLKPLIIFNIDGYFYHLMEFLKETAAKGFADRMPFIVVDNAEEAEVVFETLKDAYTKKDGKGIKMSQLYSKIRQIIYDLPFIMKQKKAFPNKTVKMILNRIKKIKEKGSEEDNAMLQTAIEEAYLEKEIERMYTRLARAAKDVSKQGEKLDKLVKRKKDNTITSKLERKISPS